MLMGVSAAWLGNLEVALSTIGFCSLNFLPIVPTYDSPARLAAFCDARCVAFDDAGSAALATERRTARVR